MVGHTHEDIDQMFLCVVRRLMKHDAVTLKELKKEIAQSYTPEIKVVEVDSMFDMKAWMEPVQEDISGHIYHHQLKIERDGEGRTTLSYKKWSTTTEWLPDAVTLKELKKEIAQSYTPEIKVVEVDSMFDMKAWMEPVQEDISGHIYHHQLKIERDGEGRTTLSYKKWSTTTEWLPKGGMEITNGVSGGKPDIQQPNISNLNLGRIKADLNKFCLKI